MKTINDNSVERGDLDRTHTKILAHIQSTFAPKHTFRSVSRFPVLLSAALLLMDTGYLPVSESLLEGTR